MTAAAPSVPEPLLDQLAEGGRLVIPVGHDEHQELLRLVKKDGRVSRQSLYAIPRSARLDVTSQRSRYSGSQPRMNSGDHRNF